MLFRSRETHPESPFTDFEFSPKKMSASGALFDLDKLDNISKNYLSKLKATEVFDLLDTWTKEYDPEFNELINKYKEYTISILNIEREQEKPRKDFACMKEIKNLIFYMYKELFNPTEYEWKNITDKNEIKNILNIYMDKYYDYNDDKDTWFNKVKLLCDELGYASNIKEYKQNPENFKGSVVDISTVIRVSVTSRSNTPDLYELLKLLGKEEILRRIDMI